MISFESLLDKIWLTDFEVFAHDVLMVSVNYRTNERMVFHNSLPNDYQEFLDNRKPILVGYNFKGYDKYILKSCLMGFTPEETKKLNDFIVEGHNPWDYDYGGYCDMPPIWDLFDCIKTFKSLKEIEGNLRMNIVETTVPFDLPTKWTNEQYEEVLYYCTNDCTALIPLFNRLMNNYKSKYIICQIGKIDPIYGLGMTDANLTAELLGASKIEHDDPFLYEYPSVVDKSKIPQEALEYFDDLINHNSLDYKREAPKLDLGTIDFQIGSGGCHGFVKDTTLFYERNDFNDIGFKCE